MNNLRVYSTQQAWYKANIGRNCGWEKWPPDHKHMKRALTNQVETYTPIL